MNDNVRLGMVIVAVALVVAGLSAALLSWGALVDYQAVGGDFWGLSDLAQEAFLRIDRLQNIRDASLVVAGVGALIGVFALLIPSSTAK